MGKDPSFRVFLRARIPADPPPPRSIEQARIEKILEMQGDLNKIIDTSCKPKQPDFS